MPDRLSFARAFSVLEKAAGLAQQRQTYISSNISNLETPNYRPKDIDFKTALSRALESDQGIQVEKTNPGHMDLRGNSPHDVEPFEEKTQWNGYNWVDIDREMTNLMKNNLMFRTAIETLLRKIALLKEVIREGGH